MTTFVCVACNCEYTDSDYGTNGKCVQCARLEYEDDIDNECD